MLVLMHPTMTQRYRIYRRLGGKFYLFDRHTGKRESLETREKPVAFRLLHARNEAMIQPIINRINMLSTGIRTDVGVKIFGLPPLKLPPTVTPLVTDTSLAP